MEIVSVSIFLQDKNINSNDRTVEQMNLHGKAQIGTLVTATPLWSLQRDWGVKRQSHRLDGHAK